MLYDVIYVYLDYLVEKYIITYLYDVSSDSNVCKTMLSVSWEFYIYIYVQQVRHNDV